ncbi:hypothetical protein [Sphingomonas sp. UYP23]
MSAQITASAIVTRTQAAFWLAPHERYPVDCGGLPAGQTGGLDHAVNATTLSQFVVEKTVKFYGDAIPNLVTVDTTWSVPSSHRSANIEGVTAYLPRSFGIFLEYDPIARSLRRIVPGETDTAAQHTTKAVILSRLDGGDAMGAFAPAILQDPALGYMALFDFPKADAPTTKWSCMFYVRNLSAGHRYQQRCNLALGSVDQVLDAIDSYTGNSQKAAAIRPFYRSYRPPMHRIASSYRDAVSDGFRFELTAFHSFTQGGQGRRPIYLCGGKNALDTIGTAKERCRGVTGQLAGYVAIAAASGLVPLYRFENAVTGDVLTTISANEGADNGYRSRTILGYVRN